VGKQVSIVGMGDVGVELVRRLQPFLPAAILYHKRSRYAPQVEETLGIRYASFEACCKAADILVGLLPYSQQTHLILNHVIFEQMKMGSLLVHAGSGGTVDEKDLLSVLQSGRLGGAALDTYESEPLPAEHPLIAHASSHNLILTPHVAAGSFAPDFRKDEYAEIVRYLAGEPLRHRVS
jgi:glyoxylate reductase